MYSSKKIADILKQKMKIELNLFNKLEDGEHGEIIIQKNFI